MEKPQQLQGYVDDQGKFYRFPGKRQKKKQALMLEFLANQFLPEKIYSEKEVNEILNQHHSFEDPATLRRLMFGSGLIGRTIDGKAYWRVTEKWEPAPMVLMDT